MENEKQVPVNENDPQVQVRTDLWPTMNIAQLTRQRELMLDHLSKLQSIMTDNPGTTIRNMYGALQTGLKDLSNLIDHRYGEKR
jgi:hypothetical protein